MTKHSEEFRETVKCLQILECYTYNRMRNETIRDLRKDMGITDEQIKRLDKSRYIRCFYRFPFNEQELLSDTESDNF